MQQRQPSQTIPYSGKARNSTDNPHDWTGDFSIDASLFIYTVPYMVAKDGVSKKDLAHWLLTVAYEMMDEDFPAKSSRDKATNVKRIEAVDAAYMNAALSHTTADEARHRNAKRSAES